MTVNHHWLDYAKDVDTFLEKILIDHDLLSIVYTNDINKPYLVFYKDKEPPKLDNTSYGV